MIQPLLPLVTIAIPTYNRAESYLRQALTSALSQTYPNIEIIVSDNCSTDHTEMVVKGFPDSRIQYFKHKKNIGPYNNWDFCLQQAKGTYFLLLHDDDLIDHDFIETCMNANAHVGDSGIIRTGTRTIDSEGKVLNEKLNLLDGRSMDTFFLNWFRGKTTIYMCNTLFHTEKLRSIGGFNSKYNLMQDGKAQVQLAAMFGHIAVQDVKSSFRIHQLELTSQTRVIDWCNESLILLGLMCSLVSENKALVYREGMEFFAKLCYRRATSVKSLLKRALCYWIVLRKFRYKYPPPPVSRLLRLSHRIYRRLGRTPVSKALRDGRAKIRQ
jgi:glycosyltransferase involved in cell wall biosynthesis